MIAVHLGDLVADRIAGHAAREDGQEQDLRVRKIPAQLEHDRADAFGDLRRRCTCRCCSCRSSASRPSAGSPGPRRSSGPTARPAWCRRRSRSSRRRWPPKYLSNIALFASPCTHQSVIESPCSSRSMLPCFAISTKPSCRGPIRCAVCVNVAATFSRGGWSSISDSNFFSSGCAADLSEAMNFLHRVVDLRQLRRCRPRDRHLGRHRRRRTDHDRPATLREGAHDRRGRAADDRGKDEDLN